MKKVQHRSNDYSDDQHGGQRVCPQCGAAFTCRIAANDADSQGELHCWCFDLPAVMAVRADTACLCPSCLRKAILREIQLSSEAKETKKL